jgi:hypothetical protein
MLCFHLRRAYKAFFVLTLPCLLFVGLALGQSPARTPPPTPVVIGSGTVPYIFDSKLSDEENRKIITLTVNGFLMGQVVVKVQNGNGCGASVAFWNEKGKSMFDGDYFIDIGKATEVRSYLSNDKMAQTKTPNRISYEIKIVVQRGGMRFMAERCTNSISYTAQIENYHRYIPPKPFPEKLGSLNYYDFRYRDCLSRHPGIGAPGYYKDFGEKYFTRFMNETFTSLSPDGQAFVKRVGIGLQKVIEEKLNENPVDFVLLELNNQAFTRVIFQSHVQIYCGSGWGKLTEADREVIRAAVDRKDLFWDQYSSVTYWGLVKRFWVGLATSSAIEGCVPYKIPM